MTDIGGPPRMLLMVEKNVMHAEFAKRLNSLLSKKGAAIKDLMVVADVTYEMARRYTKGTARPRDNKIGVIAQWLNCSEAYLAYGTLPPQPIPGQNAIDSKLVTVEWDESDNDSDEFYTVPLLDIELSAGNGSLVIVEAEQYKLPFRRYTLQKQGIEPAAARVVRVTGNSMIPVLSDGDAVGIDTNRTKVIDGDTYAIRDGDLLRVKILIERPDGGIIIRSFNRDDYPDEILTRDARQERITIIGRVWWSSKLW